jgi:hypothetical protein
VRRSKVCEGNGSGAWRRRPWAQFIGRGQLVEGVKEGRRRRPVELHQHVSYSKGRRRRGRLMRGNEEEATAHRLGAREAKGRRCMAAATGKGGGGAAPEEGDWEVGLESGKKASCRKRIEDRKTSRAGS